MQIAEFTREERLTLAKLAKGIGAPNPMSAKRYRDGTQIPGRARMRALVIFSEGRVTPNDIYGLNELIAECLERRAQRLARRKKHGAQPELPHLPPGTDPYYAPELPLPRPDEREAA